MDTTWINHTQPTKQVGPQDMTHVQYIQPIIDVAGSSLSSNFQYLTETWCKATASLCYACQSMVDLGVYDRC
jgi:hypothetical protein